MAGLELKVPPPVVGLACAAMMKGLAMLAAPSLPPSPLDGGPWTPLRLGAIALALVGVSIDVGSVLTFRRARTTVNPLRPANASALVTTGPFALSRNPMYVGMATLLAGWAAWLGTPWALAGLAAFVAWITRFQVLPEERVLAQRFGAAFDAYRGRVRRWL